MLDVYHGVENVLDFYFFFQRHPLQGISVKMVKAMINRIAAWTQVSASFLSSICHSDENILIVIILLYYVTLIHFSISVSGSPNLSPNPVSPASSNPGKNHQQLVVILSPHITAMYKDLKLG